MYVSTHILYIYIYKISSPCLIAFTRDQSSLENKGDENRRSRGPRSRTM